MQQSNMTVIWPIYFDSTKTRSQGRRIAKKLALPSPSINIIIDAVKNLGLKVETKPLACYPRLPRRKTGLIMIKKMKPKSRLLKDIAKSIGKEVSKS